MKSAEPEVCDAFRRRFDQWCQHLDVDSVDRGDFLAALELVDIWKMTPDQRSAEVITSWLTRHLDELTGSELYKCLYAIRSYCSVKSDECRNLDLPHRIVRKGFEHLALASPTELSHFTAACVSLRLHKQYRGYSQEFYEISESRLRGMTSQELVECLTAAGQLLPETQAPPTVWANALEMTVLTRLPNETVDIVCRILFSTMKIGYSLQCSVLSRETVLKLFAHLIRHIGQWDYNQAVMCSETFTKCQKNSMLDIRPKLIINYLKRFHAPDYRAVLEDFLTSEQNPPEKLLKYLCLLCMFQGNELPKVLQAQSSVLTLIAFDGADKLMLTKIINVCLHYDLRLPQQTMTAVKAAYLNLTPPPTIQELLIFVNKYLYRGAAL